MKTLFVCMILVALPASQVSADVEETNSNPEVTIGFGNVTNDTLSFTMDTSVDVYRFQVTMAWETGSLYCGYSGSGGLAQAHNLYVNVLYVTCLTSGYHYGSQGSNYIPSGSNDTLTSIYFRSMSPEVCIGNATYNVMLSDGEFETRQADFNPNDCLTYTPYATDDDFWYELDEGDNESPPTSPLRFDPGNDVPTVLQDDGSFDILISALNITGLLDSTRKGNSPNMGFTMIAPTDEAFQDIGFDLDDVDTQEEIDILTEILLHHTTIHLEGYTSAVVWFSDENCTEVDYELNVGNGEYAEPGNYSSWTETHTVSDDCQGNRTIGGANVTYFQGVSNGVIAVIDSVLIPDSLASSPQANEPRFNPRSDIPTNLEDDGEFGDLMDALGMTMLMDDITIENSPQMGMTIFAPTDEAFAAAGINLDDYESLQELEGLSEILLNHISFDWVLSFPDECTPTEFDMETTDSFSITISNDCEGNIFVNGAKVLYSQGVENGVIIVIDQILMPIEEEPVEEPVGEPVGEPVEEPEMEFDNIGVPGADAEASSESNLVPRTTMVLGGLAIISMLVILIGTAAGTSKRNRMDYIMEEDTADVDDLLVLLSRSKMVQIIRILHSAGNPIRFTELKERVDTSSTTLSRRLGELEDYQLVERTELQTVPVTVVYKLTDSGSALLPSLESFFEWAIEESPDGAPK